MTGDQARAAWLDWLARERRASANTLEAYGHDAAGFLGFLTRHLGGEPDLAALGALFTVAGIALLVMAAVASSACGAPPVAFSKLCSAAASRPSPDANSAAAS